MGNGPDTKRPHKPDPPPARRSQESHDDPQMNALLDEERRRSALLAAELQDAKEAQALAEQQARAPIVASVPPSDKQKRKAQLHVALLKLMAALTAAATAVATYLSITAHTVTEPKVDNLRAKTETVETASDVDHKLLIRLEKELQARNAYQDCVNGQFGSAILFGTGRLLTDVAFADVTWKEQMKPPLRSPVVWEIWVWKPVQGCPSKLPAP